MCTVSFVYNNSQWIITSNRDESIFRPLAAPIIEYKKEQGNLYYPKDTQAGGTWFVANQRGGLLVLLNGANEKHISKCSYRKSRGLILLEIAQMENPLNGIEQFNFIDIEPFTIIYFDTMNLIKIVWNESQLTFKKLNPHKNYIFSSCTLYVEKVRKNREIWFNDFLAAQGNNITPNNLLNFHRNTNPSDIENGLVINSNKEIITKNITQYFLNNNRIGLQHFDLVDYSNSEISYNVK